MVENVENCTFELEPYFERVEDNFMYCQFRYQVQGTVHVPVDRHYRQTTPENVKGATI